MRFPFPQVLAPVFRFPVFAYLEPMTGRRREKER